MAPQPDGKLYVKFQGANGNSGYLNAMKVQWVKAPATISGVAASQSVPYGTSERDPDRHGGRGKHAGAGGGIGFRDGQWVFAERDGGRWRRVLGELPNRDPGRGRARGDLCLRGQHGAERCDQCDHHADRDQADSDPDARVPARACPWGRPA
jgi:hypothetical protein